MARQDEFEEYYGKRIKTHKQYLKEKRRLHYLQTTDFNLNPYTEGELNLEIHELETRTKEYERRMGLKARRGFHGWVTRPTHIVVGERGQEKVNIVPIKKYHKPKRKQSSGLLHSSGIKMPKFNLRLRI